MNEQIKKALNIMENAYAPYSNYKVGACIKTRSGRYYTGCNIENAGISSICAERVALVKALSEGETKFESIVIVAKDVNKNDLQFPLPCGYCRQFMSEFVDDNFKIIIYQNEENQKEYTMKDLLPHCFKLS